MITRSPTLFQAAVGPCGLFSTSGPAHIAAPPQPQTVGSEASLLPGGEATINRHGGGWGQAGEGGGEPDTQPCLPQPSGTSPWP